MLALEAVVMLVVVARRRRGRGEGRGRKERRVRKREGKRCAGRIGGRRDEGRGRRALLEGKGIHGARPGSGGSRGS